MVSHWMVLLPLLVAKGHFYEFAVFSKLSSCGIIMMSLPKCNHTQCYDMELRVTTCFAITLTSFHICETQVLWLAYI